MSGHRMGEIISLFAVLPYFKNMDAQTTQAVAQAAIQRVYEPDQIILLEGEPASGLYIVQAGWLKVSKISLDGREQILQFLAAGKPSMPSAFLPIRLTQPRSPLSSHPRCG